MKIPKEEIQRRLRDGITAREAELWIADEFEHGASLLRIEEPTSKEACQIAIQTHIRIMTMIVNAIKE